jgi:uncharacterized YigZ family protein
LKPYRSAAKPGTSELTERGSRFIGVCAPVQDEDRAKEVLGEARRSHPDASHHVYAYRLRGGVTRASDDGEPSGTAGAPVLEVLTRRDLLDTVLVVTRYFGGTLLGAGGLIRAYSRAASAAADDAGSAELCPWREGFSPVPYPLYEQVLRLLERHGARNVTSEFGTDVTVRFQAAERIWDVLGGELTELTSGACGLTQTGSLYLP